MTIRWVVGLILFGPFVFAQVVQTKPKPIAKPAAAKVANKAMTVEDVTSMIEAGVPEDVIILKLRTASYRYYLTPGEIVMLKKLGASSAVLQVMLDPTATPARTSPPAPAPAPVT